MIVSGAALDRLRKWKANVGIVLGSGLDSLVPPAEFRESVSYSDFPELPKPSVPGHAGRFVPGRIGGTRVIFAQGRVHLYEGHTAHQVTAGVRALAAAGIKRLILTNAAGAANESFSPGNWMLIADQINLTGTTPLLGGGNFVDMTEMYSKPWRGEFARAAKARNIVLHEGVYAGCVGPQYETPAEVRMLRRHGADAIGMSTVLEAIQARALGLEIAGFSCLTNWAAGAGPGRPNHEEVLEMAKTAAGTFSRLLTECFGAVP